MAKKLKISVKLLGAFIIVALICFGVGFTSFIMSRITAREEAQVLQMEESIYQLANASKGHLVWKGDLERALANNYETIDVQMDGHKCYFGRWFYEGGLADLEAVSPEAAAVIRELEQDHLDLHETARTIDDMWVQVHPGLDHELQDRLIDHQNWALTVANAVMNDRQANVETDPTKCAFGQFLAGPENAVLEQNWPEYREVMRDVRIHHDALHASVIGINRTDGFRQRSALYQGTTINELNSVQAEFQQIIDLEAALTNQQDSALEYYNDHTVDFLIRMDEGINKAIEVAHRDSEILSHQAEEARQLQNIVIWTGIVSGLFLAILLGSLITKDIMRQLGNEPAEIALIAEQVSQGDLSYDYGNRKTVGVYSAMKTMSENLTRIISDVLNASGMVDSGSVQLSSSAQQLSAGTSEQASSLEEISSSMEQLVANIEQNSDNAKSSEEIASKASSSAATGGEAVTLTVEAMRSIAERIGVIEDIARNTNMLALNAAIEAARAGDAGKGFAVVASEVRKLAENSQKAAGEITEIATNSVDKAEKAGEVIGKLVPEIQRTAELVQEITSASMEQSRGADQINSALTQLNQIIQQNASASEEMAGMSEELAGQAGQLKSTMSYFSSSGKTSDSVLMLNNHSEDQDGKTDRKPHKEITHTAHQHQEEDHPQPRLTKAEAKPVKKSDDGTLADQHFEEF